MSAVVKSQGTFEIKKINFWKEAILYNGAKCKFSEMKPIFKTKPEAYVLYKKSKAYRHLGNILMLSGTLLIGAGVSIPYLKNNDVNWTITGIGLGIGGLGGTFAIMRRTKLVKAMNKYNSLQKL